MRFAALQGSGASQYAAAGKAVADEAAKTFEINRKTGPDYGEIARTGMKARSAERIKAMQTQAQVVKAGVNAVADLQKTKLKVDTFMKKEDMKQDMRKAGALAGLGKMVGAGYLASRDNTKGRERPSNTDAKRELYESWKDTRDQKIEDHENNRTDYKPSNTGTGGTGGNNSSSNSSNQGGSSDGKSTGGVSPSDSSQYGNAYMSLLTNNGLSRGQAAALTGHLEIESDNFRADTEYAPNAYGTRGRGHLQWTDTGNSGGRRTNFESFATSRGLDPTSFEANSQFLLSEMQGNHGNHWTNGGSYQGFLETQSVQEASTYLQNNYIRPGVPHTQRRLDAANNYFNNFQS